MPHLGEGLGEGQEPAPLPTSKGGGAAKSTCPHRPYAVPGRRSASHQGGGGGVCLTALVFQGCPMVMQRAGGVSGGVPVARRFCQGGPVQRVREDLKALKPRARVTVSGTRAVAGFEGCCCSQNHEVRCSQNHVPIHRNAVIYPQGVQPKPRANPQGGGAAKTTCQSTGGCSQNHVPPCALCRAWGERLEPAPLLALSGVAASKSTCQSTGGCSQNHVSPSPLCRACSTGPCAEVLRGPC